MRSTCIVIKNVLYLLVVVAAHFVTSPPDQAKKPQFLRDLSFNTLVVYQIAASGGSNINQPFVENKAAE